MIKGLRELRDLFVFEDDWHEKLFLHDGDASVLVWQSDVTCTKTKRRENFECAAIITWKDGLIASITDNTDTAAVQRISAA